VQLFERVAAPTAVGAGIVLQPTGQAVLARLGLLDAVAGRGAPLDGLRCETVGGRAIVDLAYADLDASMRGYGIHRGVLFSALFSAAAREVDVRCGVTIDDGHIDERGRAQLWDADGRAHGPFDLVVVADGARSNLRGAALCRAAGIVASDRTYPWGALWFIGEDRGAASPRRLRQVVDGNAIMAGLLPTGRGPAGDADLTSFYWSIRDDRWPAIRAAGRDALVEHALAVMPEAAPLLAQVGSIDELAFAVYHDVNCAPLARGPVAVLGDAAHAMSPQLGQGANLALLDALTLAECAYAFAEPRAITESYERRRRDHVRLYQRATRWLTPFFQGDLSMLGLARDLGMPLVQAVPLGRRMMVASMTGLLADVFGGVRSLPSATSAVPGALAALNRS
jgi:2-polyprenyl-6-methoxyphenol hydroxylase-like FAD-dependent oxidoreductase